MRELRESAEMLASFDGAHGVRIVEKVLIYAFSEDLTRVLAFRQPDHPEAGIQIPAGTVEIGEKADHAARREFREETGFEVPEPMVLVAQSVSDMREFKPEIHLRSWFAVRNHGDLLPERDWHHDEQTPDRETLRYEYIWFGVESATGFIAGQGDLACEARRCVEGIVQKGR